jgi:hypothetical protein
LATAATGFFAVAVVFAAVFTPVLFEAVLLEVVVFLAALVDGLLAVVVAELFFVVADFCVCAGVADEAGTATAREAASRHVRRMVRWDQIRIKDNPLRDSLLEVVSAL